MELTKQQVGALNSLKERQTERFFTGISPTITKKDFLDINKKLLTADSEERAKLEATERALFALCGFITP